MSGARALLFLLLFISLQLSGRFIARYYHRVDIFGVPSYESVRDDLARIHSLSFIISWIQYKKKLKNIKDYKFTVGVPILVCGSFDLRIIIIFEDRLICGLFKLKNIQFVD